MADYDASSYVQILALLQKNPYAYLLADKANSGKKGSQSATLPKIISFTNAETHRIEEFLLDVNSSGENSEAVANAIIHALKQLVHIDPQLSLNIMGHTTDSGGGGTLFALERCLRELAMPGMVSAYAVGACCLHNLQTALRNAIIEVFGEGGVDNKTNEYKMNAMQLLHGMYNIHTYIPSKVFKKLWKKVSNLPCSILPAPILTRWWSVGLCAAILDAQWDVRKKIIDGLVNMPPKDISDALRKIVCANKNLLGKKEIQSDVKIIATIHKVWMFTHFDFLQKGDPLTGDVPGYQAHLITVRYFIMREQLESFMDGKWKTMEHFRELVHFNATNLDVHTQRLQEKKCTMHSLTYWIRLRSILILGSTTICPWQYSPSNP